MGVINICEKNTVFGYKSIELHYADLSLFNKEVDLLVCSSSPRAYLPTQRSLIGSLYSKYAIDINSLSLEPEIDMRNSMGVWLSKEIKGYFFKRILCVEISGLQPSSEKIKKSIVDLFAFLRLCDCYEINFHTIAMPLIATGDQGISSDFILPHLMKNAENALNNISQLKRIYLVERNESKVQKLDESMNKYLSRDGYYIDCVPTNKIYTNLAEELSTNLKKIRLDFPDLDTINELIMKLELNNLRIFELGILSRRLVEIIVKDISKKSKLQFDLWKEIDALKDKNIASWIISYFHILRVIGNNSAHDNNIKTNIPPKVNEKDLIMALFCLDRIVDFWTYYRSNNSI